MVITSSTFNINKRKWKYLGEEPIEFYDNYGHKSVRIRVSAAYVSIPVDDWDEQEKTITLAELPHYGKWVEVS